MISVNSDIACASASRASAKSSAARSLFAEAILSEVAGGRFRAHSAGTWPRSEPNPIALEVLEGKGHDVSGLRAKTVAEFQAPDAPVMDFVFTVCDRAADEECPARAGPNAR